MHPISYAKGIHELGNIIKKTKIIPDFINVGGGFPSIYPHLNPQPLENYINEIKKAGIPTFAIAARAVAGGTFGSSFFMHDFIIIESKCVENLLFSGKRVTANILKSLDQIPEDFGMASSVIKSGLADMTLESRKELKDTLVKLGSIILKKE